jgi:hypothetical protein
VHRQDEDAHPRGAIAYPLRALDAAHAGHLEVDHDEVRPEPPEGADGVLRRPRLADRLHPLLPLEQQPHPDELANRLNSPAGDSVTSCPAYKLAAVRLRRLGPTP